MEFIFWAIVGLFVLAIVIFPDFRGKLTVLIKGFLNLFVEDQAKTPKGAEAVFNEAIEAERQKYTQASTTLHKISGELKQAEAAVQQLEKQKKELEAACEKLVKEGRMHDAEIYANRRAEVVSALERKKELVAKLQPMVVEVKQVHATYEQRLRDLNLKKNEVVSRLKQNEQIKDMYGDLDELRRDTSTDKMLGAVLDGDKELQKEVDGARIVYENKASTKFVRAEQRVEQLKNSEYLESLKKKYGGQ